MILKKIALAVYAGIFTICTYNVLPNLTPKVETEIERTVKGVQITRTEYDRFSITSSRTIVADYYAQDNELDIQVMPHGKSHARFIDEKNDGLVNTVLTNNGIYERQGNEADFQTTVDQEFYNHKHLLNVKEIIKKEMLKPVPTLTSALESLKN